MVRMRRLTQTLLKTIAIEVYPPIVCAIIVLHLLVLFLGSVSPAAGADERCRELIKTLEQDTLRLKEYVTALQNAHRERDFQMVTLLNSEIDETLKQIRKGEAEILNCPASTDTNAPALSSVKSQDSKFAEASCDELKKNISSFRANSTLCRDGDKVHCQNLPTKKNRIQGDRRFPKCGAIRT